MARQPDISDFINNDDNKNHFWGGLFLIGFGILLVLSVFTFYTIDAGDRAANGGQSYLVLKWIEKWDGKVSLASGGTPIIDMRGINAAGYINQINNSEVKN